CAAPASESCPAAAENVRKGDEYSSVVIEIDSVCDGGGNRIIRYRARDIAARVRSGKCIRTDDTACGPGLSVRGFSQESIERATRACAEKAVTKALRRYSRRQGDTWKRHQQHDRVLRAHSAARRRI